MRMPRERNFVIRTATLMVKAERIGSGKIHRDAGVNQERQRCAHTGHNETIFAGRIEAAEVSHKYLAIRRWRSVVADVQFRDQRALVDLRARGGVNHLESE